MPLPWTDETGLIPSDVFTDCAVPAHMIGCIGYAASQINEELTSSLVTNDVLVEGVADCQRYIFGDELESQISTMMRDVNTVSFPSCSQNCNHLIFLLGCSRSIG